ncbi:hypothetical protein FA10DRAFT_260865 [Acaromyces ingoldii]|uniref:Uncharacterized protein n=1 Tax=Acaromyces ingoldii TaxID=215250 RepID=A0A316YJZ3_9BASI|nr:hypothetical protein FA10DRAFT_260865 [Acaromyces ingoldii]PWN88938.1 hypothetical protein FA10DRAFT_260865 [Acaromyces ingoldii]
MKLSDIESCMLLCLLFAHCTFVSGTHRRLHFVPSSIYMEPCASEYLIQAYFLHERGVAMPNIINLDIIEEALNFYGSHKDKEAVDVLEKWYEEAKRQHERTYPWDKDRVIPKRLASLPILFIDLDH